MGKKGHLVDFVLLSYSYIQQKSELHFFYLQVVRQLKNNSFCSAHKEILKQPLLVSSLAMS